MNEWIKCSEKLPEIGETVLCLDEFGGFISLGRISEQDEEVEFQLMFMDGVEADSEPTHWMTLPAPPKDTNET